MVVADVVVVEPTVTALAAAPVPIDRVVADASVEMPRAPTPELIVNAPPVAVTFRAPEPDCTVVEEVAFVEPTVTALTAAPVAIDTVVAEASVLIPRAPTPELMVRAPPVEVTANAPEPDCTVVDEVVFVEPRVTALTPAPVPRLTVVLVASLDSPIAPVPDVIVTVPPTVVKLALPLAEVSASTPEPELIVVADVVFEEPITRVLAPAPLAIFKVLPPVELARLIVCAPVPPNSVAVPVFAPVPPRFNVPDVCVAAIVMF
jgi:hypothetical protein